MSAFRSAKDFLRIGLRAVPGVVAMLCAPGVAWGAMADESQRATARLELLGSSQTGEAFVRAVASQHRPIIDLFLDARIDVNAPGAGGRTALLAATFTGDGELANRLLAAGADPRRADTNGVTPLMIAALAGRLPIIAALRERGAALDDTDAAGRGALHYAVAAGQTAAVGQFLKTPGELAATLRDGQTLAELACATGDRRMLDLVLGGLPEKVEWFPGARAIFQQAMQTRDAALLWLFSQKFAGPAAPSASSQPWLAYAVADQDLPLLELLLACGADPNAVFDEPGDTGLRARISANFMREYVESEAGMTPLMLAAGLGQTDAVRMLLFAGANRSASTSGKSKLIALYFAAWATSPTCVQALLGSAPPREQTRIEISLNAQRATFIKDGHAVLQTAISSGRSGFDTRTGEYIITDKHLEHTSTLYRTAKMPFFMRLSCKDFGLHEGYVPGRPASHGCIRLPREAARRLFKEAPIGTWVSITR